MPARGVAALGVARRFDLLLSSAAALPILRKCRLISVYHQFHQCGERSNAAFGTQSAARLPSLAPHGSKARLRLVTNRRRFMAKPCTPHPHCAARAVIQATNWQCKRGRGGRPLVFLLGFQRGYSLPKENIPFVGQSRDARDKLPRKARLYNFPIGDVKHLATEQGSKSILFTTSDKHLPAKDAVEHIFLPPWVQLGQHVVEQ